MNFIFHRIWDNPSHWRTPSFFRGVGWNHQPDYSWIPHRMMLQLPEIPVIYSGYFYGEIMGWRNSHRNGAISLTYHWYFGLPNGSLLKIPWLNLLGIILPEKSLGNRFQPTSISWDGIGVCWMAQLMMVWKTVSNIYLWLVVSECHHPNWRTQIFQRVGLNHQPANTYIYIYIHTYIYIYHVFDSEHEEYQHNTYSSSHLKHSLGDSRRVVLSHPLDVQERPGKYFGISIESWSLENREICLKLMMFIYIHYFRPLIPTCSYRKQIPASCKPT